MSKLDELRKQIDEIDSEILKLLGKRIAVVNEVAKYKVANKIPFLDLKRKKEILDDKIKRAKGGNIPEDFVKKIFETIHDFSLKMESKAK
jgi:chorismate mutase